MERTWKLTAAGILCIIGGIIGVVPGIAAALFLALIDGGWLGAIGGLPLIILGTIAIVGGIYAFKRRIWRLALAGSICALIGFVILVIVGIFIMLMLVSDNPEVFPFGGTIFDAYAFFCQIRTSLVSSLVSGFSGYSPLYSSSGVSVNSRPTNLTRPLN